MNELVDVWDIKLNFSLPGEHVPDIERMNRVLQERLRVALYRLPFKQILRTMIVRLALRIMRTAIMFPAKEGISRHYATATIISGRQIDYKRELVYSYGDYVQAYHEQRPKNNNLPRTKDCIYLQPSDTLQRGHEVMDLMTGELIRVTRVDKCVMTQMVIARVEELATRQGYSTLKFFNRKKTALNLPRQNFETLLKRLKEDHEDIAAIEDVNNFLLHTIHTEKIQKTIELCELYYALEADVHKKDVPEIFCCLHRRLDPIVITEVHETQYPGIRTRFFRWIEKKFKTNIITNIRNRIIQTERLGQLISTVQSVIKIESSVLDLFKDLFLATSILFTIGGPVSVWLFPTNFSSIVAMIAFATVIIPLVLSSLMLMITDPWAIVTFDNKRNVPRPVMTLLCFLLFGITPILLLNSFKAIKEEAQRTAKKNKKTMSQIFKDYRAVKRIFVELLKVELGKDTLLK